MRGLVAVPLAWHGEGLAQLLRGLAPGCDVRVCNSASLLDEAAPAEGRLDLAIVACPWVSLATLLALRRGHPDVALVVCRLGDEPAPHLLERADPAAVIAADADPQTMAALLRLVLRGDVSIRPYGLRRAGLLTAGRVLAAPGSVHADNEVGDV